MNRETVEPAQKEEQNQTVQNTTSEEDSLVAAQVSANFEVEEKSTTDLEEWIEEQGIQLRY